MKINVTTDELVSIFLIYLLDKINNPDELYPKNEEFEKIMGRMEKLKSHLTKFYLDSEISNRIYYKRIRDAFEKEKFSENYVINIIDKSLVESQKIDESDINNNINFFEIKEIVKNTVQKIRKFKFKKSSIMKDSDLDKIIEKSIKEYFDKVQNIENKEE